MFIYINDLPLVGNIFTMLMYVDDTTLYCNVNNDVTVDLLNYELSKICDWLGANKLALNVSKTKFMVFHTINKHVIYPKLNMKGQVLELYQKECIIVNCYSMFAADSKLMTVVG